jgi:hypothetical protein
MPSHCNFLLVRPWDLISLDCLILKKTCRSSKMSPRPALLETIGQFIRRHTCDCFITSGSLSGQCLVVFLEKKDRLFRSLTLEHCDWLFASDSLFANAAWGGGYKGIASDHHIISQVKDMASIPGTMDTKTLSFIFAHVLIHTVLVCTCIDAPHCPRIAYSVTTEQQTVTCL